MCTVTFLPLSNNNFILTSNRDEQPERITLTPKKYIEDGVEMVFPKDELAGGTWIGTSSKNRLVCVLNGAFKKHQRKSSYKKSRGVIAKEILKTSEFLNFVNQLNLDAIEPFTMVIVDWNENLLHLYELVWDGEQQYFSKLKNKPKIWSSSTLYESEIKDLRIDWFQNWVSNNDFNRESILGFHHSEIGDKEQSILMKRTNVETVSITTVKKESNLLEMDYEDIIHEKKSSILISKE